MNIIPICGARGVKRIGMKSFVRRSRHRPASRNGPWNYSDTARALGGLQQGQREAVILVGAAGLSYADAAQVCGAPLGTMKSRVARGRVALMSVLNGEKPIPPRSVVRTMGTTEHILSQLTARRAAGLPTCAPQSETAIPAATN